MPDICKIDKNNLKKFNDALAADGHDYELEIKTLSYDNYGQAVEGALENGKTDIAFLGLVMLPEIIRCMIWYALIWF